MKSKNRVYLRTKSRVTNTICKLLCQYWLNLLAPIYFQSKSYLSLIPYGLNRGCKLQVTHIATYHDFPRNSHPWKKYFKIAIAVKNEKPESRTTYSQGQQAFPQ